MTETHTAGTRTADTRATGAHTTDAYLTGTHAAGTHTTAGTRRTPAKALRESTFEAAKPVAGRKTSARVNSHGTSAAVPSQQRLRSGAFAAAPSQRCHRSNASAAVPSQRHLRSGAFAAAPSQRRLRSNSSAADLLSGAATGRLQNGSRPASAPFTRRPRLCYARSSPLVAITFWYQAKLSLRERSSVPLP